MENKTEGAWLINHTKKLLEVKETSDFEDIELAGKCGIFLFNLAASEVQSDLNPEKIVAIARVSNIKKTEIETIKAKLAEAKLIDIAGNVEILVKLSSEICSKMCSFFKMKMFTFYLGVIPKVATPFFAKWPHLSLQSGHSVSPESVQSADFKAF